MDFVETLNKNAEELLKSDETIELLINSVREAINGVTSLTAKRYFNDFNIGRKHAGLSTTLSKLILIELEDRGWQLNYQLSTDNVLLKSSLYLFDAASIIESNSRKILSLDIAFDNRQKLGTLLLKPEAAKADHHKRLNNIDEIVCHVQVLATKEFKEVVGIDSSACSYEEYIVASEIFEEVLSVPTVVIGLNNLEGVKLIQRKDANSRKKSQIIVEEQS
jgi:hypothetical protein